MQPITRRRYTDDFKAQAILLAESLGPSKAARQLDMSVKTCSRARMVKALRACAHAIGHKRVARLMREEGLSGKTNKGRFMPRTTDSRHARPVAENLLDRQSEPSDSRCWRIRAGHRSGLKALSEALPA